MELKKIHYVLIGIVAILVIMVIWCKVKQQRQHQHHAQPNNQTQLQYKSRANVSLSLPAQSSSDTSAIQTAVNSTISSINTQITSGINQIVSECLNDLQTNNTALNSATASACSAQLNDLSTADLATLNQSLATALTSFQNTQTTAVQNAISAIKSAIKYSAPNFTLTMPSANNLTASLSLDGMSLVWNDGSNTVYKRATPLTPGQDPTILDYNNSIPNAQSVNPSNAPTTGSFNWVNGGAIPIQFTKTGVNTYNLYRGGMAPVQVIMS